MMTYIVIVNYCNWSLTCACLDSLAKNPALLARVIVIDNGSPDESYSNLVSYAVQKRLDFEEVAQDAKKLIHQYAFVRSKINLGYSKACNVAIEIALDDDTCDYIWLLNNDTIVDNNALEELTITAASRDTIGMVGSCIIYSNARDTLQALAGGYFIPWLGYSKLIGQHQSRDSRIDVEKVEKRLDFILGASWLVKSEVFRKYGLLDESFFLYFEELDFALRAKGYTMAFAQKSIVYHHEGATIDAMRELIPGTPYAKEYYFHRNRLRIVNRYFRWAIPTAYASIVFSLVKRLVKFEFASLRQIIMAVKDSCFNGC